MITTIDAIYCQHNQIDTSSRLDRSIPSPKDALRVKHEHAEGDKMPILKCPPASPHDPDFWNPCAVSHTNHRD